MWRTAVTGPVPVVSVLPRCVVAEPGGRPIAETDAAIAIGPEGGWTDTELGLAVDRVRLGPNILRTESAAIAASTLLSYVRH